MELATVFLIVGAVIFLWLGLWILQRRLLTAPMNDDASFDSFTDTSSTDVYFVADYFGRLLYVSPQAREWLKLNDASVNIEYIAQYAEPQDTFLQLFSEETRTTLQYQSRQVEAVSYRIPAGKHPRIVVSLQALDDVQTGGSTRQISRTLAVVSEMNQTLHAGLGVDQVLQTALSILRKVISIDAAEINLYDEKNNLLMPRGYVGDFAYPLALAEAGGTYDMRRGITGWIAQYRRPLLVADRSADDAVRPYLNKITYQSFIGVPLMIGERFIGTLELAHAKAGTYTTDDLTFLQTIAQQVASSIYNAELYASQTQRIDDMASLQSLSDLGDADPHKLYTSLYQRVAKLLNVEVSGVLLYDERKQTLYPELPFLGLPEALLSNFSIDLANNPAARSIWQDENYWLSNDLSDEPLLGAMNLTRLYNPGGIRNMALFPLEVGKRRFGMLFVGNHRSQSGFSSLDIQNLRLLASQVSVLVEDQRLDEEEKRRESEMLGLQEITQAIGTLSSNTEFYANITKRIARVLNVPVCGVLLYEPATNTLTPQTPFLGLEDEVAQSQKMVLTDLSPMLQIFSQEDSWLTNNATIDRVIYEADLNEFVSAAGLQKILLVPLESGGRRMGLVEVARTDINEDDFTLKDVRLLQIFAAQIAGMIDNARLFRETQRREAEAQLLRRIAESTNAITTGDDSVLQALREVAQLFNSEITFVNLFEEASYLSTREDLSIGFNLSAPMRHSIYQKGFEHSVAVSRRPFMTNDVQNDKRVLPSYKEASTEQALQSVLLVPLVVGDESLGELGVASRSQRNFTEDDLRLLGVIAAQFAGALDRIRLYEASGQNLRRRLQELDAISRVSNELAQTLDLETMLDMIRHEAVRASEAEGSSIVLFESVDLWDALDQPRIRQRVGEIQLASLVSVEIESVRRGVNALIIRDFDTSEFAPLEDWAKSALLVAFTYEDEVVGIIHLYHSRPEHFTESEATFLLTLAAKASLSYGNYQRYFENRAQTDSLRRRVEQLKQIFELGAMMQSDIPSDVLMEAIAYSVQQNCGYDVAVMLMIDPTMQVFQRVAQVGMPIRDFQETLDDTITLEQANQIFAEAQYQLSELIFLPAESASEWQSWAGIEALSTAFEGSRPITSQPNNEWRDGDMLIAGMRNTAGQLIGLISVDRPFSNQRPDRNAIEILEIIAHQASSLFENSRLYAETVRSGEQEARINDVLEAIASTLDLTEIARLVGEGLGRIGQFQDLRFALINSLRDNFTIFDLVPSDDGVKLVSVQRYFTLLGTAIGFTIDSATIQEFHAGDEDINQYSDLVLAYGGKERSTLILPLITGGLCIGALYLGMAQEDSRFFHEDLLLLKRIANLTAVAFQNAILFEETTARTQRLSLLNNVSIALAQSLDTENILEIVMREISNLFEFDYARAYWIDRDTQSARVITELPRGDAPPEENIPIRKSAILTRINNSYGEVFGIEDVETLEKDDPLRIELQGRKISSYVAFPLAVAGQPSGVIELVKYGGYLDFETGKLDLAQIITNQAAVTALNSSLLEQTLVRTRELETLLEAAQATSMSLELTDVFQSVVRLTMQALNMDSSTIMIYDNVDEVVRVEVSLNQLGESLPDLPQGTAIDLFQYPSKTRALRDAQVIVIHANDPETGDRKEIENMQARNITTRLLIPLVVRDIAIGILQTDTTQQHRLFSHREIRMVQALGTQAATAIENARLSTETAAQVEQSLFINDISQSISSTMDIQHMLKVIHDYLPSLTEADDLYVALYDAENSMITFPMAVRNGEGYEIPSRALNSDEISFVIRNRRPLLLGGENPSIVEVRRNLRIENGEGDITRYVGVPMIANDQVVGAIALRDNKSTRPFGLNDQRILMTISAQLGAAIQNANLFVQVRNFANELNVRVEERTQELQEEAEKSSAILEGITDGVVLVNSLGQIVLFNPAAERLLEIPQSVILNASLTALPVHLNGVRQWVSSLSTTLRETAPNKEIALERLSFGGRIVNVVATPIYNGDQFLGIVSVLRDVTRDVEVDRMKSEFVSNVSHELRTPMTSIKGYADLLLMGAGGKPTEQQEAFLRTIKQNADRLTILVNDLLDISRLDSGEEVMNWEQLSVSEVLSVTASWLEKRSENEDKPMDISIEVEPNLPRIWADNEKLSQILQNLAENAFNYSHTNGSIRLGGTSSVDGQSVILSIADSGVGIPEEFRERVWNRFERYEEHALALDIPGTGLGLAIVKHLVEMHDARIYFDSEVGQGTTFYVEMPLNPLSREISGPDNIPTVEGK